MNTCKSCYWAYPESYRHIAMRDIRRLDLLWSGEEVADFDMLINASEKANGYVPEYAKKVLRNHFRNKRD